ncbi:MAG: hypothetical protein WCT03_05610 [Candidatus Obscuribacterales bacterium]|jgi:hypothetical protein
MQNYPNNPVHYIFAGSPNTPDFVLEKLARSDSERIRQRVAENCNTNPMVLIDLVSDSSVEVRLAVATNANLPLLWMRFMTYDQSADVRLGMAENVLAPPPVLLQLARDENPFVAARARKSIEMRAQAELFLH